MLTLPRTNCFLNEITGLERVNECMSEYHPLYTGICQNIIHAVTCT